MTINIHNADLELCGHFLWDLSERAIREKFNFELKKASDSLHNNAIISVNEFEAHYTIVKRAFQYLEQEPTDQTKKIGQYVINWLLQHLESLRKLEEEGKGRLRPDQQSNIGQNLYKMFRNGELVERHWESFGVGIWWAKEMVSVREWFLDTAIAAVVRKQDKKWCDRMREPDALKNPTKDGYLEEFVRVVVKGLFCDSERSWPVDGAVFWIKEFMKVVSPPRSPPFPPFKKASIRIKPRSSHCPLNRTKILFDLVTPTMPRIQALLAPIQILSARLTATT